jgi:class 3 adenylate cyclase
LLERIGQYEILGELGRGATGVVYRARQGSLNRDVALKVLAPSLASDPGYVARFHREAELASSLEHPLIVPVYDTGVADGWHYIAMRLVRGATLEEAVRGRPPAVAAAVGVAALIAEALAYAHEQGVVHRDLKPSNVLTTPEGHIALVDFGIARAAQAPGFTQTGAVFGTPEYMAPEQARGEPADARSDVYALGMVLYFLLAGRPAFTGGESLSILYRQVHEAPPSLRALNPQVPRAVEEAVAICLAKDPAARFQTAAAARQALNAALEMPGVAAPAAAVPGAPAAAVPEGEMAALSLDVVRSMQLKQLGDEQALNETFAAFRTLVNDNLRDHGCLAHCWSGDGALALFPAAAGAVGAATAIQRALPRFNRARAARGGKAIQARAAVHAGPVPWRAGLPLGEVTSQTLDLAGRLQKSAQPGEVVASWAAYSQLAERAGFLPGPRNGPLAGSYCWSEWNEQQDVAPAPAPAEPPLDPAKASQLQAALAMQSLSAPRAEAGGPWARILGIFVAVWAVGILIYLVASHAFRPVRPGPTPPAATTPPAGRGEAALPMLPPGPRLPPKMKPPLPARPGGKSGLGTPPLPSAPAPAPAPVLLALPPGELAWTYQELSGADGGGAKVTETLRPAFELEGTPLMAWLSTEPGWLARLVRVQPDGLTVYGYLAADGKTAAARFSPPYRLLPSPLPLGTPLRQEFVIEGKTPEGAPFRGRGFAQLAVKGPPQNHVVPAGVFTAYPFHLVEEFAPSPTGGPLRIERQGWLAPLVGIIEEEVRAGAPDSSPPSLHRKLEAKSF